jgi:O-antigen ligase
MIGAIGRPRSILFVAGMFVLAVFSALGLTVYSGTKTGVVLALMAALGPLGAYAAIVAPLVFPFSLFVVLVPFDNLLAMNAFGTATRLLAMACGACLVFWLLRTRQAIAPDRAMWWWLLLAVWAATSMIWAIDPDASVAHMLTLCQLLSLYGALSLMPIERRTLYIILAATVLSGALASAYGSYVFRHGIDVGAQGRLFLANASDNDAIDPNHFGAALILPVAVALMGALRARSAWMQTACIGALLVMGAGIAISGSRGAAVALALTMLYIIYRLRTRLLAAGVALAALCAALAVDSNLVSRFATAASSGGAGRLDIWRIGLAAFREYFWVGAGYSNFPLAYDRAFISVFETHYTFWHRAPHNILLSIGVELGIVGLAIFLVCWFMQFRAMRSIRRDDPLFAVRTAVEGAILGLFVAGFFLDVITTKYLWLAFMLAMLVRNAAHAPGRTPVCERSSYPIAVQHSPISS